MHSELIEWVVTRVKNGERTFHTEGAQSVFGLTRARKVVKALGPPWEVRKQSTLEEPTKE
jgi:hypothetical protein